jgi:CubicO group peptidase (beta-lactamase class C family)
MLLNEGQLDGVRILAPRTVQLMRSNHLPDRVTNKEFGGGPGRMDRGVGFGYDFGILIEPFEAGSIGGAGTFSWAGAAGTWFWIDPELDVVFVGMVQRWWDPVSFGMANLSRQTFYQALTDPKK